MDGFEAGGAVSRQSFIEADAMIALTGIWQPKISRALGGGRLRGASGEPVDQEKLRARLEGLTR